MYIWLGTSLAGRIRIWRAAYGESFPAKKAGKGKPRRGKPAQERGKGMKEAAIADIVPPVSWALLCMAIV